MHDELTPDLPVELSSLVQAAAQAYDAGDYRTARTIYARALEASLALNPPDALATAQARRGLGATLLELGEPAAGEALLVQARAAYERLLGPDHPDTAQALFDLGAARFYQADLTAALRLTEQALAVRSQALGSDHPHTIESLNNLGVILARQGQRERAIAVHSEALARCERSLGDHRATAETLAALAAKLVSRQETYDRARTLYQRALAISERVLGPGHPTTARLLNNLAAVQADLGDDVAARLLLERSLSLHERLFGLESPHTAWVLVNLGDIERRARRYPEARARYIQALISREAALGAQHPETVTALRKLVGVFGDMGRDDPETMVAAMPLYQCLSALDPQTAANDPLRALGASGAAPEQAAARLHTLVARLAADLSRAPLTPVEQERLAHAAALERQAEAALHAGDAVRAQTTLEQAIILREQVQGVEHADLVAPLRLMEAVMVRLKRPSAVLPLRERAVLIQLQALGADHPLAINALTDLMSLVAREYGLDAAAPLQERILVLLEQSVGPDAPVTRLIHGSIERMRAQRLALPPSPDAQHRSRSEQIEEALAASHELAGELLADVDEVPWHRLSHAYGAADDVPDLLRLALSDNPEVRDEAYEQLFSTIVHQGTVYEASAFAVPFLLRMLADERTPERLSVLHLLSCLSDGASYQAVHQPAELQGVAGDEQGEAQLQRELGWVRAAHEAVAEGLELFFALLERPDTDAALRQEALFTIAQLPGRAAASVPRLRSLLGAAAGSSLRTGLVRALHDLMDDGTDARQLFAGLLAADQAEAVRLIAAVALLTRGGADAPEAAVHYALDVLKIVGPLVQQSDVSLEQRELHQADELRFFPAWGGGTLTCILEGLSALGGERARAALLEALRLLRDPEDAERAAASLLALVFPSDQVTLARVAYLRNPQTGRSTIDYWGQEPRPSRGLGDISVAQREVLAALVEHEPLWAHESNLLTLYGWPAERAALRALLAEDLSGAQGETAPDTPE